MNINDLILKNKFRSECIIGELIIKSQHAEHALATLSIDADPEALAATDVRIYSAISEFKDVVFEDVVLDYNIGYLILYLYFT